MSDACGGRRDVAAMQVSTFVPDAECAVLMHLPRLMAMDAYERHASSVLEGMTSDVDNGGQ